jgi:excinuclease UvrABC nuclease subunit
MLKPKHNTLLKEYGDKYFLKINISDPFPVPEVCNNFDFDGNDYFGLFISRKKAAAVLDMINRTFALRECSEAEFSKERKCFLAEIERCTAPCVNKERSVYTEELDKVYEFLYGKSQFALNRLLNKMKEYSNDLKYEKAAEVKEIVDLILSQIHKSSLLAEPVNLANVLFEIVEGNNHDYIVMLTGKIFIKKYVVKEKDYFEDALDDYFETTINRKILPDEEDLEKIKITLNWLIKNRNKVRIYYLKDYRNKQELYSKLSNFNSTADVPEDTYFDVRFLIDNFQKEKVDVEEEI